MILLRIKQGNAVVHITDSIPYKWRHMHSHLFVQELLDLEKGISIGIENRKLLTKIDDELSIFEEYGRMSSYSPTPYHMIQAMEFMKWLQTERPDLNLEIEYIGSTEVSYSVPPGDSDSEVIVY